jgi:hypothetical protein
VIVAAAIKLDGRVWALPRPARHPDVIRWYCRETGADRIGAGHVQGFVTERGAFLGREAALEHARESGQLMRPAVLGCLLTSEDLW